MIANMRVSGTSSGSPCGIGTHWVLPGWIHSLRTISAGSVYNATYSLTSSAFHNISWGPSNTIPSRLLLMTSHVRAWSAAEIRATWSCCSDPDITANMAHPPVQIIWIYFGRGESWRDDDDKGNAKGLSCCCRCCCVPNHGFCSYTIVSFTIARLPRITVSNPPTMYPHIRGPMLSENLGVTIQTPTFPRCICPISIPWGGDIWLFNKMSSHWFLFERCFEYSIETIKKIEWFGLKNETAGSGEVNPIRSRGTVTVVLWHPYMAITGDIDRYQIR